MNTDDEDPSGWHFTSETNVQRMKELIQDNTVSFTSSSL